jgi:hypothetical protein
MVNFINNEFEPLLIESKVLTKCFDKVFENWDLLILVGIVPFLYSGYVNECPQLNIHLPFIFITQYAKLSNKY